MEPNSRSYQPFLIGQGVSKTGLFTYLESWVKPEDAYDELTNAYIYRGSLWQRPGISLFPSESGAGALVYQDNTIVAVGDGGTNYADPPLLNFPLIGTATITAIVAGTKRSSTASFGVGDIAWSTGGGTDLAASGTINFATGEWSITTVGAVAATIPIVIQYNYVPTSLTTPVNHPIMGIVLHQDQTQNTQKLFVVDTRRASRWDSSPQAFVPIQSFQQIIWAGNGDATATTTINLPLRWENIAPYSVSISAVFGGNIRTITDVPTSSIAGGFTTDVELNALGTSSIDYVNGTVTITWTAPLALGSYLTITASLQGDYFSGDNTNFFKFTNWQTVDNQPSYLYMTNNFDFVTLFDGTYLSRPPFAITSTNTTRNTTNGAVIYPIANDFSNVLDIKIYKNRLLFIRPTLINKTPDAQSIRWSQLANVSFPLGQFNFVADVAGNGGELSAATGDWIQCAEFLRDILTVFFQNSTWVFRFTGNTKDLFRFDKISGAKSTSAPYGSVEYDDRTTSMGAKGLIACNGVSVARYDESIIDFVQNINQNFFKQCFAQRFDNFNQTWMLFPTQEAENTTSNQVLIYNFLENTWATFLPNLGYLVQTPTEINTLSCLGIGSTVADLTWANFAVGSGFFGGLGQTWSQATYGWNSFQNQDLSPSLLGGDQNGFVYFMMDGATDNPGPATSEQAYGVPTRILSKRFNPFISQGVKARFGYLDVYYEVNADVKATFNFYLNNSADVSISYIFTFDGKIDEAFAWKRIYISAVAEFVQIEITSVSGVDEDTGDPVLNTAGPFKILGMTLYAAPAGRLTPGTFL